jgi:predicted DNA-binding transcriptional regulator AlpA
MKQLLCVKELAAHFGVSRQAIWRWYRSGLLPRPYQIGRRHYFFRSDIDDVIRSRPEA